MACNTSYESNAERFTTCMQNVGRHLACPNHVDCNGAMVQHHYKMPDGSSDDFAHEFTSDGTRCVFVARESFLSDCEARTSCASLQPQLTPRFSASAPRLAPHPPSTHTPLPRTLTLAQPYRNPTRYADQRASSGIVIAITFAIPGLILIWIAVHMVRKTRSKLDDEVARLSGKYAAADGTVSSTAEPAPLPSDKTQARLEAIEAGADQVGKASDAVSGDLVSQVRSRTPDPRAGTRLTPAMTPAAARDGGCGR